MSNTNAAMSMEQELAKLRAENEKLKANAKSKGSGLKVSEKGAVSIYGYGRFPITMYAETLLDILGRKEELSRFVEENRASLKFKATEV